jgi:hypothetical protein
MLPDRYPYIRRYLAGRSDNDVVSLDLDAKAQVLQTMKHFGVFHR